VLVGLWAAVTCSIAVLLGRAGGSNAEALSQLMVGLNALGAGCVVMVWGVQRRGSGSVGELPRMLMALACLLWGLGQVLVAWQVARGTRQSLGPGDLVGAESAPVVVLALLRMPRRSRASRPGVRLAIDAVALSLSCTTLLWWVLFRPLVSRDGQALPIGELTLIFFDLSIAALTLLVAIRDRRDGAGTLAVGAALQAGADLVSVHALAADGSTPWQGSAIWCLAWPVIGLGLMRFRTDFGRFGDSAHQDLGEARATEVSTVLSGAAVVASLIVPAEHRWTPFGIALYVAISLLFGIRGLINNQVRSRLVSDLGTEALRDALTGLPNRRALTARITALEASRPWVLLTVDLDGFKEVNDQMGHVAGDELIAATGAVLSDECPGAGMTARIGGDEFAVLAPGTLEQGEQLAERLSGAVRTALAGQVGVAMSACIGIGRVQLDRAGERHQDRLAAMVESAAALRAAKALGRDRIAAYPGAVEQARERRIVLERRLREVIDHGLLEMHAQPLVDLHTGAVRGFESLARWNDEELGVVSPAEFVPVAEQTGMVVALGEHALRRTLMQAGAGGVLDRGLEVGVNVSPIQLRFPNFAPKVVDLVAEFGIEPHRLVLEVTEAILVDEDDPASGTLARLAEAGVKLAIDDFGTGYSALGYLRRLPVDMLKIDRSWVVAAVTDRRTRDIVGGVVGLAHKLGATVVMEGIEDAETARMCRDLGAHLGQGWLFGRPRPWPVAAAELASGRVKYGPPVQRAASSDAVGRRRRSPDALMQWD
jgi:diguanylate cyclase (GGDEF)-like protein